jgi:hypothetical protein
MISYREPLNPYETSFVSSKQRIYLPWGWKQVSKISRHDNQVYEYYEQWINYWISTYRIIWKQVIATRRWKHTQKEVENSIRFLKFDGFLL